MDILNLLRTVITDLERIESEIFVKCKSIDATKLKERLNIGIELLAHFADKKITTSDELFILAYLNTAMNELEYVTHQINVEKANIVIQIQSII